MLASKLILKCLEDENTEVIFGYPGGALLPMYEALRESPIRHILVRNEQAAPHYASGYARISGRTGVCMATSGPGATNLVTGIATAYLDSIPLVAITGQVNRDLIGTDAFQEADITGATEPFTKHSYLVKDARDLPRIIKEAFHIASTGRPGPVLIDIPRDVQLENVRNINRNPEMRIPGYKPNYKGHTGQVRRAIRKIKQAKRPVIYAGGGVKLSYAEPELLAFAEINQIPVITTLMGIGCFPEDHSLYCGIVGSHGYDYSNAIMDEADLCICIAARMSDRGISGAQKDIEQMELIHIDIDPAEIGKNIEETEVPIVGDARTVLADLLSKDMNTDTSEWLTRIEEIKDETPVLFNQSLENGLANPKIFFEHLSEMADDDAILFADVGLNQIWAALYYHIYKQRKFFTSGGLGTMGYSIPAAAGAAFAVGNEAGNDKQRQIFCVCGDGSFQMSLAELAIVSQFGLNINILLFTNTKLGMVRQLQHDTYGKDHYSGTDLNFEIDFMKLAQAYGIPSFRASTTEDAVASVHKAAAIQGPAIVQIDVDKDFLRI
ncbi:MAG: biosynthetic-type acetolactate synthase large subunit [Eubacteriaceae bacterium]|jgi:acetolactate synthase-1/2/3 large subunit